MGGRGGGGGVFAWGVFGGIVGGPLRFCPDRGFPRALWSVLSSRGRGGGWGGVQPLRLTNWYTE